MTQGRRLRVCVLTSVHSPFDQRVFYKEAVSLAEAGYDVTLIGPGPAALAGEMAPGLQRLEIGRISHGESLSINPARHSDFSS